MITEDYVSFGVAKLLKERGFNEWCFKCYGVAVLHNGADISFDEECELKDEGRGDEIEYVEGGILYDYASNNREKVRTVWAAPTLWAAMKWLREKYNTHIEPRYFPTPNIYRYVIIHSPATFENIDSHPQYFNTYEEACEAGIRYCLENLIQDRHDNH